MHVADLAAMLVDGPAPAQQVLAGRHWAYSVALLERGVVIFADANAFASVVIRAADEAKARAIVDGDPAVRAGMCAARLYPFQPMLMGEWPANAPTAPLERRSR